jgi:hypothetical protein
MTATLSALAFLTHRQAGRGIPQRPPLTRTCSRQQPPYSSAPGRNHWPIWRGPIAP